MKVRLGALPRRRPDVEFLEQGDDCVLVTREGEVFALNPTARAIWDLCDGRTTVDELAAAIAQIFVTDQPSAHREVLSTVRALRDAELVIEPAP